MYTYLKSFVKEKGISGRWLEPDAANNPVISLLEQYEKVFLVLENPSFIEPETLDLKAYSPNLRIVGESTTITEWLASVGNGYLPTVKEEMGKVVNTVKFNDLYSAGYKISLIARRDAEDSTVSDDEKTDILLTRPETDYGFFYHHCLVTVNGLIHRTDYGDKGIYVRDGAKSSRIRNEHHLGGLSFASIGELEYIKITSENIYKRPGAALYEVAMVELPEEIGNRVPVLVLGGYLHILDGSYTVTGDRSMQISLRKTPFIDRFYSARNLMDMSPVENVCNRDNRNKGHFVYEDLIADQAIEAFLTLDNSFIVLVNTDNLRTNLHKLEYPHLPGRYYSYEKPNWPLMTELGRLPSYLATYESTGTWVISVCDNLYENRRYFNHEYESEFSLDGSLESAKRYRYAPGFLLEISSDVRA